MEIVILGCLSQECLELEQRVLKTVVNLGINAQINHALDENSKTQYGTFQSPGLVINNELVLSGYLPDQEEVDDLLISLSKRNAAGELE